MENEPQSPQHQKQESNESSSNEPQQQQQNPAERRINQLFARAKTAEERVQALEVQQQELQTKLLEATQENAVLKTGASTGEYGNGSGLAVMNSQSSGNELLTTIRSEIKDALGEVRKELQEERMLNQLKTSQRAAFSMAMREFPELQDPNSQLFKFTDQILTNDPDLRTNPQGPYKAALMARGVLGGGMPGATNQQKAAATVPDGAGTIAQGSKQEQIQKLETLITDLQQKLQTGQGQPDKLWQAYRNAKIAHGILTGKNVGKLPAGYEKFNQ